MTVRSSRRSRATGRDSSRRSSRPCRETLTSCRNHRSTLIVSGNCATLYHITVGRWVSPHERTIRTAEAYSTCLPVIIINDCWEYNIIEVEHVGDQGCYIVSP